MAISAIIESVMSRVPGQVPSFIGPEHIVANAVPPRLVWVPAEDSYGPPERLGDAERALRTRIAGVELRVWATDYAAVELLLNQVLAAVHGSAPGSYEIGKGVWLNRQSGPMTDLGRTYVVQIRFKIPITAAPPQVTTVKTIPVTTTPKDAPSGDAVVATLEAP